MAADSASPRAGSWLRRFVSNPDDGRVVIAQPPNLPIAAWALTGLAALFVPDGRLQAALSFFSAAFLFTWAYLELTQGDSPFRRVMGGAVLAGMVVWRWLA
jgi:hypothetical protein